MSDDELISYCDIHCQTQRALFNGYQITRMAALAGEPYENPLPSDRWWSMHSSMKDLVDKARARIASRESKT